MPIRLEDAEHNSQIDCVKIPKNINENVTAIKDIGTALHVTDKMIDNCHRFGERAVGGARGMIMKFVKRLGKD